MPLETIELSTLDVGDTFIYEDKFFYEVVSFTTADNANTINGVICTLLLIKRTGFGHYKSNDWYVPMHSQTTTLPPDVLVQRAKPIPTPY